MTKAEKILNDIQSNNYDIFSQKGTGISDLYKDIAEVLKPKPKSQKEFSLPNMSEMYIEPCDVCQLRKLKKDKQFMNSLIQKINGKSEEVAFS